MIRALSYRIKSAIGLQRINTKQIHMIRFHLGPWTVRMERKRNYPAPINGGWNV